MKVHFCKYVIVMLQNSANSAPNCQIPSKKSQNVFKTPYIVTKIQNYHLELYNIYQKPTLVLKITPLPHSQSPNSARNYLKIFYSSTQITMLNISKPTKKTAKIHLYSQNCPAISLKTPTFHSKIAKAQRNDRRSR